MNSIIVTNPRPIGHLEPTLGKRAGRPGYSARSRERVSAAQHHFNRYCYSNWLSLMQEAGRERHRLWNERRDDAVARQLEGRKQQLSSVLYEDGNAGRSALRIALSTYPKNDNLLSPAMCALVMIAREYLEVDHELDLLEADQDHNHLFHIVAVRRWWASLTRLEAARFARELSELDWALVSFASLLQPAIMPRAEYQPPVRPATLAYPPKPRTPLDRIPQHRPNAPAHP